MILQEVEMVKKCIQVPSGVKGEIYILLVLFIHISASLNILLV